jgi:hypothetical protein
MLAVQSQKEQHHADMCKCGSTYARTSISKSRCRHTHTMLPSARGRPMRTAIERHMLCKIRVL